MLALSVALQTVPAIALPPRHARRTVGVPSRTVSCRSMPAGFKKAELASIVMSNELRPSEPLMKTPIRISWPIGPEKTAGLDGQGPVKTNDGSAKQTVPVCP